MSAIDLMDYLGHKHENRNWGYDAIRVAAVHMKYQCNSADLNSLYNVFRGIGTCESRKLTNFDYIQKLSNYYLVWYKPNQAGTSGPCVEGSVNYRFDEYANALLDDSIATQDSITNKIRSFEEGLINDIDIVVGLDTSLNKGLIVDGTNRSLALFYLRNKSKEIFEDLLASDHSIYIVYLKSPVCRILFPIDFCRLC